MQSSVCGTCGSVIKLQQGCPTVASDRDEEGEARSHLSKPDDDAASESATTEEDNPADGSAAGAPEEPATGDTSNDENPPAVAAAKSAVPEFSSPQPGEKKSPIKKEKKAKQTPEERLLTEEGRNEIKIAMLSLIPGIGRVRATALVRKFKSFPRLLKASKSSLSRTRLGNTQLGDRLAGIVLKALS